MEQNLFSLSAHDSPATWAHGKALATGNVKAAASLHRGLDLSASLDFQAQLSGELKDAIVAKFSAGGEAGGSLGLQAAFPLDLFTQAGVIAQLQAKVEAGVFVQAELGVGIDTFNKKLRERLAPPWADLVDLFLSELRASAGLWAHASVSAQATAKAALVGNLLAIGNSKPGFTSSFGYKAGWGAGTGMDFVVNVGLENPERLLDRLADGVAEFVEAELAKQLANLLPDEQEATLAAMAVAHFLLPLATRAAFRLGFKLATTSGPQQKTAVGAVAEALVGHIQEFLLRQLMDLGVHELNKVLSEGVPGNLPPLTTDDIGQIVDALKGIRDVVTPIADHPPGDLDGWFTALSSLLDPMMALLETKLLVAVVGDAWRENVALIWACAVLFKRLTSWSKTIATDPASTATSAFDSSLVGTFGNAAVTTYIGGRLNPPKPGEQPLMVTDLVLFILSGDREQSLRDLLPASGNHVLDWLEGLLASVSDKPLLAKVLQDLGSGQTGLVDALVAAGAGVLKNEIEPQVLQRLEAAQDPYLQDLTRRVLRPTLRSLIEVIIPNAKQATTDQGARRLREQVSAILLQFLSRFVLGSLDASLELGLGNGSQFLRNLATTVGNGQRSDVLDAVVASCTGSAAAIAFTKDDVADLLRLAANTLDDWSQHDRADLIALLQQSVDLGTSVDDGLNRIWASDSPADYQSLVKLLVRLEHSAWRLLETVAPEGLAIIARHYERAGQSILAALDTGAGEVLLALKEAVTWLNQDIAQIQATIQRLVDEIRAILVSVTSEVENVARRIEALQTQIIASLRDHGWQLISPLLTGLPEPVPTLARREYDALFDAAGHDLDQPFQALSQFSTALHDEVIARSQKGLLDRDSIVTAMGSALLTAPAGDLQLPLRVDAGVVSFDLGTHVLSADTVRSTIQRVALSDNEIQGHIDSLIRSVQPLADKQRQTDALRAQLNGDLSKERASHALDQLTTGHPLAVHALEPVEGLIYRGKAPLELRIDGANHAFVTSVLGVPKRVQLLVNGNEYPYALESWTLEDSALVMRATVLCSSVGTVPRPVQPVFDFKPGTDTALSELMHRGTSSDNGYDWDPDQPGHVPGKPLLARRTGAFFPAPAEAIAGFRRLHPDEILGDDRDSILVGPGLNTVQLLVVDGKGARQQATRTFELLPALRAGLRLSAYVTLDQTARILYRASDNHINEVWLRPGSQLTRHDLSTAAGAPLAIGDPFGYFTPVDRVARVCYRATDQHIHELWLQRGPTWTATDLSGAAGAPNAVTDPCAYFSSTDQVARVAYRAADQHIHELWLKQGATWNHADLTALAGASIAAGRPQGYFSSVDNMARVVYRGLDNNIHELALAQGASWKHTDLSAAARAPAAIGDSFGFYPLAYRMACVLYCGIDQHLHALWNARPSQWQHSDVTVLANAPGAAGTPFGYFAESDQIVRIVYRGVDQHIHELSAASGGSWQHKDLSSLSNAPLAGADPTAYVTPFDHTIRVLYRGADDQVHELSLAPGGTWTHNILIGSVPVVTPPPWPPVPRGGVPG